MEHKKRVVMLIVENDVVGDRLFFPEVAQTLREYADELDACRVGNGACDVMVNPRGTRIISLGSSFDGPPIAFGAPTSPSFKPEGEDAGLYFYANGDIGIRQENGDIIRQPVYGG